MADQRSSGSEQNLKENIKRRQQMQKAGMKDGDFEELFGKDIDQFLEDSEWDMKDIDNASRGSDPRNARQLEKELKKKQGLSP